MKKLIACALLVASVGANAIENTFTFTVESSGPDMYACNAGIKHVNPAGQVGYTVGDGVTATTNPGDYLQDVMQYSFGKYDEWTDTYTAIHTDKRVRANGSSAFTSVAGAGINTTFGAYRVNGNPQLETLVLKKLNFELSSERYGAEYFVDICYYGPRFDRGGNYFAADAEVTMTNTFSKNYLVKAGLVAKAELVCDGSVKASTAFAPMTSGNLKSFWNGVNIGEAKKVCVTRFSFKESSTGKRMNIEHGSEVVVRAEIVDPIL